MRDCTLAVCVQSASVAFVIGLLICARIGDQRHRYFVTGYRVKLGHGQLVSRRCGQHVADLVVPPGGQVDLLASAGDAGRPWLRRPGSAPRDFHWRDRRTELSVLAEVPTQGGLDARRDRSAADAAGPVVPELFAYELRRHPGRFAR